MRPSELMTRPAPVCRNLAAIGLAVLVCAVTVQSQEAGMDAQARTALERMLAAYKSLESFHIKVTWTARYTGGMSRDDFPLPGPDALELRMQRPNKFYMAASARRDKASSYVIVSDGASLWYWRSAANTYVQLKAPEALADMVGLLPRDAIGTLDDRTWNADKIMEWDLLVRDADPIKELAGSGLAIALAAPEKIGNVPVDVVRFKIPEATSFVPFTIEYSYYLSAANHLIQGYRLAARGKNPENGRDFTVTMQATYDVHDTQPRFSATDFVFTPPRGARQVGGETR